MKTLHTGILIIGSGIAGLLLALELAQSNKHIIIATKDKLIDSNTSFAQGGMAAITKESIKNDADSIRQHIDDTINAGAFLSDFNAVTSILGQSTYLLERLEYYGMKFDRLENQNYDLAKEGGHESARILHKKDCTGKAISKSLICKLLALIEETPRITILENHFAIDLLCRNNQCYGGLFLNQEDGFIRINSKHNIICTGGIGQIYSRTSNPSGATGDGIAMAYRAGAIVQDMEFVQFHPTALCLKNKPSFLISEAVRGAGAHIINKENNRFVFNFSPKGELATRDIVSKAIVSELSKDKVKTVPTASSVFLDMRPLGKKKLKKNFPNILKACLQAGLNPITTPVPIAPAAHYFMGGIKTDVNGITSVSNLYAIGEASCTGLHGANRLASNSLLEAGVMALNLAKYINKDDSTIETCGGNTGLSLFPLPLSLCIPTNIHKTKELLFQYAGPLRNEKGLTKLAQYLNNEATHTSTLTRENIEAANMLTIAKLVTSFALERKESRGAHLRSDYPQLDQNNFQTHKQTSITEVKMPPEILGRVANITKPSSDIPVKIQSLVRQ